jgi:hypothetical protein
VAEKYLSATYLALLYRSAARAVAIGVDSAARAVAQHLIMPGHCVDDEIADLSVGTDTVAS